MRAAPDLARLAQALRRGASPVDVADELEALALDGGSYAARQRRRNAAVLMAIAEYKLTSTELAARLSTYAGNAWPRDRAQPKCPERHADKIETRLFEILSAIDRPLTDRQIRNIIRGNSCAGNFRDDSRR